MTLAALVLAAQVNAAEPPSPVLSTTKVVGDVTAVIGIGAMVYGISILPDRSNGIAFSLTYGPGAVLGTLGAGISSLSVLGQAGRAGTRRIEGWVGFILIGAGHASAMLGMASGVEALAWIGIGLGPALCLGSLIASSLQATTNRAAFEAEGRITLAPVLDPDAPGLAITAHW